MKIVVLLVIVLVVFFVGFAVARLTSSDRFSRKNRRELETYRTQQYKLARIAGGGTELNEGTAFKVLDLLEETRKEIAR